MLSKSSYNTGHKGLIWSDPGQVNCSVLSFDQNHATCNTHQDSLSNNFNVPPRLIHPQK